MKNFSQEISCVSVLESPVKCTSRVQHSYGFVCATINWIEKVCGKQQIYRNINERSSGSVWISAWYRPNEINQRVAARRKGTQNISVECLVQTLGANACLPRRDTPNDTVNNRLDGPAKCTDSLLAHRHAFVIYRSRHVRLSRFPLLAFTILFAFFYLLEEQRE